MRHKPLGDTGRTIPEIGLGTWSYHGGPEPLRKGIEAGACFVDTAESYGTEPVVGVAIAGIRDRVFLATKVSAANLRPADLRKSADGSLQRLGTDWIDLYQIHEPNPKIPIEETMAAMEELADAGKIRHIGVSNFSVADLTRAQQALTRHRIVANQVRYNLADRTIEGELLAHCRQNQITIIAYSPLSRSLSRIFDCDPQGVLTDLARATGTTAAQVALNWCLCQEGVVAIPKGNSIEHVLDNCRASDWRLTPAQVARLDASIRFRRRGRLDQLLRRNVPTPLVTLLHAVLRSLPPTLRRRIN